MSRGGKNARGTIFRQKIRVFKRDAAGNKTSEFVTKIVDRTANVGVAAQAQILDLVAQICEAERGAIKISPKELAMKEEKKAVRQAERSDASAQLQQYGMDVCMRAA